MSYDLLTKVQSDLKQINQQSTTNIDNLNKNYQDTLSIKNKLINSEIDLLENTAKKISESGITNFKTNKGRVITRDELSSVYTYKCSNLDLIPQGNNPNDNDNYNTNTKTFTSSSGVEYQIIDFDLKYDTYIILTQEQAPKRYILSPLKDVISVFFEKTNYNLSDNIISTFVFHKSSENSALELSLEVWKTNGNNISTLAYSKGISLESVKRIVDVSLTDSLTDSLTSGSYYLKVKKTENTPSNVEILSNELILNNGETIITEYRNSPIFTIIPDS